MTPASHRRIGDTLLGALAPGLLAGVAAGLVAWGVMRNELSHKADRIDVVELRGRATAMEQIVAIRQTRTDEVLSEIRNDVKAMRCEQRPVLCGLASTPRPTATGLGAGVTGDRMLAALATPLRLYPPLPPVLAGVWRAPRGGE